MDKCITVLFVLVANNEIKGSTDVEKAAILEWMSFSDNELLPASCAWVFPFLGIIDFRKPVSWFCYFLLYFYIFILHEYTRCIFLNEELTIDISLIICYLILLVDNTLATCINDKFFS